MLADHIIEESYVNPLTLAQRDGKRIRTCLDAWNANKFMTPDRTKVPPMQMLLRRFHGAGYISTLDLSRSFYMYLWKRPQENGQGSSSRTSCTNLHAYHTVSEILSVLLLGHFSQYWGLMPVNTYSMMQSPS